MGDLREATSGLSADTAAPAKRRASRSGNTPAYDDVESKMRSSTSERLLDIAAALFWTKGYAGTTTREIAAVLGIRKASLYHHVRQKEDLLYEICVTSLEHIHQAVESAVGTVNDPLERVRVLIRTHVRAMLVHRDMHSTMLTELRALGVQRSVRVIRLRDRYEQLVRDTLSNAQQAGVLRVDVPAKYLCLSLLGQLNWAIFWYKPDGELSSETLADVLMTIYLNGVAEPPITNSCFPPQIGLTPSGQRFVGTEHDAAKSPFSTLPRGEDA